MKKLIIFLLITLLSPLSYGGTIKLEGEQLDISGLLQEASRQTGQTILLQVPDPNPTANIYECVTTLEEILTAVVGYYKNMHQIPVQVVHRNNQILILPQGSVQITQKPKASAPQEKHSSSINMKPQKVSKSLAERLQEKEDTLAKNQKSASKKSSIPKDPQSSSPKKKPSFFNQMNQKISGFFQKRNKKKATTQDHSQKTSDPLVLKGPDWTKLKSQAGYPFTSSRKNKQEKSNYSTPIRHHIFKQAFLDSLDEEEPQEPLAPLDIPEDDFFDSMPSHTQQPVLQMQLKRKESATTSSSLTPLAPPLQRKSNTKPSNNPIEPPDLSDFNEPISQDSKPTTSPSSEPLTPKPLAQDESEDLSAWENLSEPIADPKAEATQKPNPPPQTDDLFLTEPE